LAGLAIRRPRARLSWGKGRGDRGKRDGGPTGGGVRGRRPDFGVDGAGGRTRGGRISQRCRGSSGLQARMSHEKGRGGHDGRVERLTSGGAVRERLESRRRRKAMAAGSGKHGRRRERPGHGTRRQLGRAARRLGPP
jgi:hypothetical protein